MSKYCTFHKEEHPISDFYKCNNKNTPNKKGETIITTIYRCKKRMTIEHKKYDIENKEKRSRYRKQYEADSKDKIKAHKKIYRAENKDAITKRRKKKEKTHDG